MPQMRTSIKIRADYRPANKQDGNKRCRHCSRRYQENVSWADPKCKLLGITINPDYTCREFKAEEK